MIRKWYLNFYRLDASSGSIPAVVAEDTKRKARLLITVIGYIIDLMSVYHMILCGMALAYIIILQSAKDHQIWMSYFVRLTQFADYFFYISSFLIFICVFIFAGVLHIVKWDPLPKYVLIASAFVLLVSLFSTTYALPMSLMVTKLNFQVNYWYKTSVAMDTIIPELYNVYRPLAIFRMVTIIVTSPFVAYFTSDCRGGAWESLLKLMDAHEHKKPS